MRHLPCERCGSRDNNALFTDGHTFCFGCSAYGKADGDLTTITPERRRVIQDLLQGEPEALVSRKITQATCAHFGYLKGKHKGKTVQIAPYYDSTGALVAQKVRDAAKNFAWHGDAKDVMPFGWHAFPKTGKMLVLTEGEIDALAMSQVQGNAWPVWSISCGADKPTNDEGQSLPMTKIRRYIARIREHLLGFEKVVIMFDNDEQGRASARVAAEVIGPRAHIAELPADYKDAGEMLENGKTKELLDAMWRAKQYRPEGIVELDSLKERVMEAPLMGLSWCFETLTTLTYGKRLGELYALGAGTGVGKTDFFTQDIAHMVLNHGQRVGVFSLEQGVVETAKRIAGKVGQKTFHVPDGSWTEADLNAAWARLTSSEGKVYLYDSFGANEWDSIKPKIEYLVNALGVQWIYLDHLTALAAAEDDERTALERIMAEMGALVKRLNITITFVSHLATPEGKPHEEGGRVTIRHFKGSRSIGYWSHFMFGLERDQQADDEATRTTTTFRVLKDRYTGRATGEVFYLGYDRETGTLFETEAPDKRNEHGFKDETTEATEEPSADF